MTAAAAVGVMLRRLLKVLLSMVGAGFRVPLETRKDLGGTRARLGMGRLESNPAVFAGLMLGVLVTDAGWLNLYWSRGAVGHALPDIREHVTTRLKEGGHVGLV